MHETLEDAPYRELLRLDELLAVLPFSDGSLDRSLFLVVHQVCEMWFALILEHLDAARAALADGDPESAATRIGRLPSIMRVLAGQFEVLATLTPESFEEIRTGLGTASGIQSAQWREIEFVCGQRETRFLRTPGFSEQEIGRLLARMEEISLSDAYEQAVKQSQDSDPAGVAQLRAALLDFDEAVVAWRARHASLAERFLGTRTGTAGSAGAAYLWKATGRRLFPSVWPQTGGSDA